MGGTKSMNDLFRAFIFAIIILLIIWLIIGIVLNVLHIM